METHRRGSDGRRIFTADFKREQIERVLKGSITLSELSRELSVSLSVVRRWKHLAERGNQNAMQANEEVVPARELRAAHDRIRELERALGKKAMEVEILQAARDELKKVMLRQALTSQARIEALDESIVRRFARPREVQSHLVPIRPVIERPQSELGSVVHVDHPRKLPSIASRG